MTTSSAQKPPTPAPVALIVPDHLRRHPLCDCGACCDACGHTGCTSQSPEANGTLLDS